VLTVKHKKAAAYCTSIALILIAAAGLWVFQPVRNATRWLLFSRQYKSQVLAQAAKNGELQHIEWDSWGWAGQDTTVYLAFDPNDSLIGAATTSQPGKYSGLPCEVYRVRRLETRWYTVQFYTDQSWGRPDQDCH
jgi:hypothetical protein